MKFIIFSPPYDKSSGGGHALYTLNYDLNKLGYDSSIMNWNKIKPYDPSSIVIYPEIIHNNPLNAKHVVRYILHINGFIFGRPVEVGPTDFLLTWNKRYYPTAQDVLYKYLIPSYFNDQGTKTTVDRTFDCTYIGKGSKYKKCEVIPHTIHIGSHGSLSKPGLADLFRNTRILYTYDSTSMLNAEALLCGAMLCFLEFRPFNEDDFNNPDLELGLPRITVENGSPVIPKDYEEQRRVYIDRAYSINRNYMNKLESVVIKIKRHFNL